jgi:hypothetical protein
MRTMNKLLQRTLMAYRPLYLHGLLRDGQYHLPAVVPSGEAAPSTRSSHRRMLLLALTGLRHRPFLPRSPS